MPNTTGPRPPGSPPLTFPDNVIAAISERVRRQARALRPSFERIVMGMNLSDRQVAVLRGSYKRSRPFAARDFLPVPEEYFAVPAHARLPYLRIFVREWQIRTGKVRLREFLRYVLSFDLETRLSSRSEAERRKLLSYALRKGLVVSGPACNVRTCAITGVTDFARYFVRYFRSDGEEGQFALATAVEGSAFHCDATGSFYNTRNFTAIEVDGQIVCEERADLYEWDDGTMHLSPEPDRPTARAGYGHDPTRNSWRAPRPGDLGIEIECLSSSGGRTLREVCEAARKYSFAAEEDGSLDSERGVELISPPMPPEELLTRVSSLASEIRDKADAWDAGNGYGMHVSLNCDGWDTAHVVRFLSSINSWKALMEKIAGRKEIHWAKYYPRPKAPAAAPPIPYEEKYQAAALRRRTRIEVRAFRSGLNPNRVKRNIEFTLAVRDWTKDPTLCPDDKVPDPRAFVEWTKDKYPNVYDYLKETACA